MWHIIDAQALKEFISEPKWTRYASSANGPDKKVFDFSNDVVITYRVRQWNEIKYLGTNIENAVAAYNDLP